MKKLKIVGLIVLLLQFFAQAWGQMLKRLDEDRGGPTYKLQTDLTEAYYLGQVVEEGNYLVKKAGTELNEFYGGQVIAIRYYHKNFVVGQIAVFIKKEYDLVVKKKLLDIYGKPTRFSTQAGVESAAWIAEQTSLHLDLNYKSQAPEDAPLAGAVAIVITHKGFAEQEILERIDNP
jgi:hypothetical protein